MVPSPPRPDTRKALGFNVDLLPTVLSAAVSLKVSWLVSVGAGG